MSCPAATPNRCIQKHLSHSYVRVQRRYDSLRETSYRLHLQTAKIQEQARNGEILKTYPRCKESASHFKGNQPGDYRDLRIPADHSHSKRAAKTPESCGKGVERTIHSTYEKAFLCTRKTVNQTGRQRAALITSVHHLKLMPALRACEC